MELKAYVSCRCGKNSIYTAAVIRSGGSVVISKYNKDELQNHAKYQKQISKDNSQYIDLVVDGDKVMKIKDWYDARN